ncbi:hypothetical protein [Mucilaginibacter sp. SP1R1]|uniref:hypothetical protein n=1 Tax=Mucilaginibacter sp. SP1R1 TaxID=2723091 RepID=UPI00160ECA46|nr:hypothetical protein [Mucilaginibacter sp. SP1R1]MBB6151704.1 3-hydroxymyristoyl/3-hydroxydecanoyl-(acyl carrier protein) dehydratase [Mucilaginibacter sp. SP1R1]
MDNLLGTHPSEVLSHGPTKLLISKYHWHLPSKGIVVSYTPNELDVKDHFGIFRGVDQIESFAQASIVSCGAFNEKTKQETTFADLKIKFIPVFISTGPVHFHSYLEVGDTFICIAQIKFYKFRQMTCDGRIYKVPKNMDLDQYFSDFDENRLLNYDLSNDFVLVAELNDITGRAIKADLLK